MRQSREGALAALCMRRARRAAGRRSSVSASSRHSMRADSRGKGFSAAPRAPIRAPMFDPDSPYFTVDAVDDGDGVHIHVATSDGGSRTYALPGRESQHYFEFFRDLHRHFGTRLPHFYAPPADF